MYRSDQWREIRAQFDKLTPGSMWPDSSTAGLVQISVPYLGHFSRDWEEIFKKTEPPGESRRLSRGEMKQRGLGSDNGTLHFKVTREEIKSGFARSYIDARIAATNQAFRARLVAEDEVAAQRKHAAEETRRKKDEDMASLLGHLQSPSSASSGPRASLRP